ncbi:DUF6443 domain-containing protein [Aquimarina algiphila]|uniref:DUF6443 domain-containing protein n=1 Tax=Aquimarina algiphila TaxID=2047982 RepID=UPI0023308CB6|nr:DUF6443 domain-containing protein [Aquimarina algiphila]
MKNIIKNYIVLIIVMMGTASAFSQFGGGSGTGLLYLDGDNDGYGRSDTFIFDDGQNHPGYASKKGDCNDFDEFIFPGAPELCDGKDNDCDGSVDESPKPPIPSTVSVNNNCGNSVLTRGNPPSGITWFWQTSASGTNTGRSGVSITLTSGSVHYLRGKNNSTGCWGTARSVGYNIIAAPSFPSAPSITKNCGNTVITRGTPPSGNTWYWQSSDSGTSTANSAQSITRTSGSVYFLRARHNTTGCWSNGRSILYSINTIPAVPTASVVNNCGSSVLTKGSAPSGITWYWQSSATGTSTSNASASITRTSGSVYYLRARNNSTGCWSSAKSVGYSIKAIPSVPTASVVNNCGNSVLTKGTAPSGVTWYWQSSPSGTSTSNANTSITRISGSVYYLRARNNSSLCWSVSKTVNYSIKVVPGQPTAPTVSNNCGSSVLTKGSAPSGVTWYWQSSASGTSTSNSSTSITRTSGNAYYLRARNNSSLCWGTVRKVNYYIKAVPAQPTAPTVSNNCGSSVLTKGTAPSGVTWYWQSSASGTSTSNASASITRTSGSVYYLRARNNSTECWSSAKSVGYSINAIPSVPTAGVVNNCGSSVLTKGNAPSGITWYWQSSATGTSTSNASTSITRTSGSVYYLRARNNSTGCWSSSNSVGYSIKAIPAVPTASVVNNCGSSVLTKGSAPSGITWYWQSSASGTSTSNASASITRTSGSVYYLRARNNSTGCWSSSKSVGYSINTIPAVPTASVVNNCGSSVLTKGSAPSGVTWYWQSSASGTSTSNSSTSITRTSGSVYYLRARNNSSLCWSAARTVNYSIQPIPIWYADIDGDGFGDPNDTLTQCIAPAGYVTNANDQCPEVPGENSGCAGTPYQEITISNENYVFTRVYQNEMESMTGVTTNRDVIENITYFDGLGRPKQQVGIKASPTAKDIVTHIGYDVYGRQAKQHLPFERATNTTTPLGSYGTVNVNTTINSYYQNTYGDDFTGMALADVNAYSESIFEPSPLNRVAEQGAPGKDWKANPTNNDDHTIKFDWDTNIVDEVVRFKVTFSGGNTGKPQLVKDGFYVAGELYVTIIKDENWQPNQTHPKDHTSKEYKDKRGRVVLKQTFNEGIPHDTYYVYDQFDNLTYVIPPKVTTNDPVYNIELSELCYQYKYDHRNRLVEKKIPGKGWEYIIYDKLDQPILTQDANQKAKGEWLFTKYDALGRVAYTGKYKSTRNRGTLLLAMSGVSTFWETREPATTLGGTTVYYSNVAFPTADLEILTVNYYDNYSFDINGLSNPGTVYGVGTTDRTRSLATGGKVRVLGINDWITTVTYYDDKARPIYVASKNDYLNTTDIIESKLDFVGRVEETKTTHTKGTNAAIVTVDKFTYDHTGRLLKQTQKINTQAEEVIAENNYDALGQLTSKKVGGTSTTLNASRLQEVNYQYNVRGWLTSINEGTTSNGDLFGFSIGYNQGNNPLYNGNISRTEWETQNDNKKRHYNYSYDALNRIQSAGYNTELLDEPGWFNVTNISYDKNGNLLTLNRAKKGSQVAGAAMDYLTYNYDHGNKLLKVKDQWSGAGGFEDGTNTNNDFTYDVNGNMISDQNKGITSITYNHLNLPETVSISNSEGTGDITYIYDATGTKLKKIAPSGSSLIETEYAGNYIYKNNVLQYMSTPEGYATPTVTPSGVEGYRYVYQYKDHLDNVRLSYTKNDVGNLEIIEENNYYPFGLTHKGYNNTISSLGNSTAQLLKFGGKEEQNELGLGWIDITARNYDPTLGRWMNLDPMAEKYYGYSSYNYTINNPVKYVDPDGMDVILLIWTTNNERWGHAAIAVTNYEKDDDGNYKKDVDGNYIPDGTFTFYNLWPDDNFNPITDSVDRDRKPDYFMGADADNGMVKELRELLYDDPTRGAEDWKAPDGAILLRTSFDKDQEVKSTMESFIEEKQKYNNIRFNCTDYCIQGIETASDSYIDAEEPVTLSYDASTPNRLFRETKKMKSTYILKDPGEAVNKDFNSAKFSGGGSKKKKS